MTLMILIMTGGLIAMDEMNVYSFEVKTASGDVYPLDQFRGKVLMIVNVASKCGFTPQYEDLQKLYENYKDKGLVILGFPANNFMNQEPGSNEEIQEFCQVNYGVTFPVLAKISVKGRDIHPLYAWLTDKKIHPETGGSIGWNFTKFLIDTDGKVSARYASRVNPRSDEVIQKIERLLEEK
ncbi:MAG TPA: glutathione peroxidase [Candidatus Marinimicrobia bacterium]|nr:glutathione peroxidase [Candidatus Neomarinimicrobiota bacterium]